MRASPAVENEPLSVLAESIGAASSGVLTAKRGKHRRLICLELGQVVFVASNMIEEQLAEYLVLKHLIVAAVKDEAQKAAAREQKSLSAVLLGNEWIQPSILEQAIEKHARQLILSTLRWRDAEISFDKGTPRLARERTFRLSGVMLILKHVSRHPTSIDEVRVRIGPPNMRPVLTPRAARAAEEPTLSDGARSLLEGCDGTRSVSTLVAQSKVPKDDLLRMLHAFLLLGVVEAAKEETAPKVKGMEQASREEIEARLHQANGADHYIVLGVDTKATAFEIREAYYLLARRFHPDRFSTGPLADLRPRIEHYFTQVTEAYNTLFDAERRTQYDGELSASIIQKKKEPDQDTAYLARENFARARLLLDRARYQDAVTFLENAIQLDGSKAEYHLELGRVLIRNPRRRQDAEIHLRRATELDPTSVPGFVGLGQLYSRMSRFDAAAEAFREALRWEPENLEAQRGLADLG